MDPHDQLADLADALRAGGVAAALDPRDVNAPGVLVSLDSIRHDLLCGEISVRARLVLAVPDTGAEASLAALGPLLADVLAVVTPNTELDTTYVSWRPSDTDNPLPALQAWVDL